METAARTYRSDWWADEDQVVELWAEKAAVAGIVEPVARRWGIPFLACRGFSSLTALVEATDRFGAREAIIVYVGDHDPSGLDMDRDLSDRFERLGFGVDVCRVALTVDQIDEYDLPPQPTKVADARSRGYSAEHAGSWELDALPAEVLEDLVTDELEELLPDVDERRAADDATKQRIAALVAHL